MIKRQIFDLLLDSLLPERATILYGPRRTGKTTILEQIKEHYIKMKKAVKFVDGEDVFIQKTLSSGSLNVLTNFLKNIDLLIIDEAQKIENIGSNIKLMVDHFKNLKIIASGSASFELAQKVGEPLTGRKRTFHLYPFSLRELIDEMGYENHLSLTFNQMMIYGSYPKTVELNDEEKQIYLKELTEAYLYRDILELEDIKNSKKLHDLLTLLAYQIGNEVSHSELGSQLGLHKDTVARYLDLLEKSFVIFNIRGFSRNLRKEVTKTSRYYFYDNGIRNAIIRNFNPLELRNDSGALWENFLVMERIKKQNYENILSNNYFWRTYDQKEIDWVEEHSGKLFGYEFKYGSGKERKSTKNEWLKTYDNASYQVINQENYLEFI